MGMVESKTQTRGNGKWGRRTRLPEHRVETRCFFEVTARLVNRRSTTFLAVLICASPAP